ncbi:hypothetical protein T492DRAFT_964424 [Pavlovales sp. CCMP2436]|nr:hypothetical protein T492DRAFT_964424 [Pavlovales sp. CCMP2436]
MRGVHALLCVALAQGRLLSEADEVHRFAGTKKSFTAEQVHDVDDWADAVDDVLSSVKQIAHIVGSSAGEGDLPRACDVEAKLRNLRAAAERVDAALDQARSSGPSEAAIVEVRTWMDAEQATVEAEAEALVAGLLSRQLEGGRQATLELLEIGAQGSPPAAVRLSHSRAPHTPEPTHSNLPLSAPAMSAQLPARLPARLPAPLPASTVLSSAPPTEQPPDVGAPAFPPERADAPVSSGRWAAHRQTAGRLSLGVLAVSLFGAAAATVQRRAHAAMGSYQPAEKLASTSDALLDGEDQGIWIPIRPDMTVVL